LVTTCMQQQQYQKRDTTDQANDNCDLSGQMIHQRLAQSRRQRVYKHPLSILNNCTQRILWVHTYVTWLHQTPHKVVDSTFFSTCYWYSIKLGTIIRGSSPKIAKFSNGLYG
jgi:hypothetical protein